MPKRQSHCSDLLELGDDYFLSHTSERFILSVTQFSLRHLNRTLMMRHHHANKIGINIARGLIPMSIIIFVIALTFSAR